MQSSASIKCITAGSMTGTAVLTGAPCPMRHGDSCSFHAVWTGTPTGTFTFEFSNDTDPVNASDLGWTGLTLPASFTSGNPVGSAAGFGFGFVPYEYRWIRVKYTNASSTGTLNVVFHAKGPI